MPPTTADAARANELLVRRLIDDIDTSPALETMGKWLAADFTTIINGSVTLSKDQYLEMAGGMLRAFSNIRHEILDIVADEDTVAVAIALHLTHTAEYDGIPATGRTLTVSEMSIMRIRDGVVASERVFVDLAGMHQQLTASH